MEIRLQPRRCLDILKKSTKNYSMINKVLICKFRKKLKNYSFKNSVYKSLFLPRIKFRETNKNL